MVQHEFKVQTNWNGGRDTVGNLQGDILEEQISIPSGLGVMVQELIQMNCLFLLLLLAISFH